MESIIEKMEYYLAYPFVKYALIVGVLIALCSSLLGVTLVLRRFSFIGDGLSHVAFGAMAVATIFHLVNDTLFIMPVTVIAAILLLRTGQNTRLKGDAAIAMLSVGALAIGYLVLNVFSTSATQGEVNVCVVMSICVVVFYIIFYNRIFSVTFDENFTKSMGKNTELYNLMIAVITAVIIVLAMNLVGSLLVSALIIFPALSAMRMMHSFKEVVIYAAILSVIGALFGMLISILWSTPVGSTIVLIHILIFFCNCILGKILGR